MSLKVVAFDIDDAERQGADCREKRLPILVGLARRCVDEIVSVVRSTLVMA